MLDICSAVLHSYSAVSNNIRSNPIRKARRGRQLHKNSHYGLLKKYRLGVGDEVAKKNFPLLFNNFVHFGYTAYQTCVPCVTVCVYILNCGRYSRRSGTRGQRPLSSLARPTSSSGSSTWECSSRRSLPDLVPGGASGVQLCYEISAASQRPLWTLWLSYGGDKSDYSVKNLLTTAQVWYSIPRPNYVDLPAPPIITLGGCGRS